MLRRVVRFLLETQADDKLLSDPSHVPKRSLHISQRLAARFPYSGIARYQQTDDVIEGDNIIISSRSICRFSVKLSLIVLAKSKKSSNHSPLIKSVKSIMPFYIRYIRRKFLTLLLNVP